MTNSFAPVSSKFAQPMTKVIAHTVIHLIQTNEELTLENIGLQEELDNQTVADIIQYLDRRSLFVMPNYQDGVFRGFVRSQAQESRVA